MKIDELRYDFTTKARDFLLEFLLCVEERHRSAWARGMEVFRDKRECQNNYGQIRNSDLNIDFRELAQRMGYEEWEDNRNGGYKATLVRIGPYIISQHHRNRQTKSLTEANYVTKHFKDSDGTIIGFQQDQLDLVGFDYEVMGDGQYRVVLAHVNASPRDIAEVTECSAHFMGPQDNDICPPIDLLAQFAPELLARNSGLVPFEVEPPLVTLRPDVGAKAMPSVKKRATEEGQQAKG